MAERFRGTTTHKVDSKGRVSIPADFRRVLDAQDPDREAGTSPRVVILFGDSRTPWLECYSIETMAELEAKVETMDDDDPRYEPLVDYVFSDSQTVPLDGSGRLVLTKELRDRVGIGEDAVFRARGKYFRIYSPDVPDNLTAHLPKLLADLPPEKSLRGVLAASNRPAAEASE